MCACRKLCELYDSRLFTITNIAVCQLVFTFEQKALEQISKLQSKFSFLEMSNHVFQQMSSSFDRKYNYDEPHVDVEHTFLKAVSVVSQTCKG